MMNQNHRSLAAMQRRLACLLVVLLICASWTAYAQEIPEATQPSAPAPASEATAAPKPTAMPEPTQPPATSAPTEAPVASDTPAPEATPGLTGSPAPSPSPTQPGASESPAPSPTEPGASESPAPSPTVPETSESPAPTQAPDASPSPSPESSPSPTPDATATPSPGPKIYGLPEGVQTVSLGDAYTWNFSCEGEERVSYTIRNRENAILQSGEAVAPYAISFRPGTGGGYVLTVTAESEFGRTEKTSELLVLDGACQARLTTGQRSAFAGEDVLDAQVSFGGGASPYALRFEVLLDGKVVHEEQSQSASAGQAAFRYAPKEFGVYSLRVEVTDASGQTASDAAQVPVGVRERESARDWLRSLGGAGKTGDWRTDLLDVARSQIGYQESRRNFIVREDGSMQGYTRYGDWYGMPYEEWCAMFVLFCLRNAQLPESAVPGSPSCARWRDALAEKGVYRTEADYVPQPGDLIFFRWSNGADPEHIGIVESVEGETIFTIEGNAGRAVRRRSYVLAQNCIAGYGDLGALLDEM